MVNVFREARRVLRSDGTLWLNYGDAYNAHPGQRKVTDKAGPKQQSKRGSTGAPSRCDIDFRPKDLMLMPSRIAIALQDDGWYVRSKIIWHKPNPMPESVTDRPTSAYEEILLLTKSPRYFFDADAVKEASNGWAIGGAKTRGKTAYASASGVNRNPQRDSCGGLGGDGETRNLRNVWTIATAPYKGAHFATFPPKLVEPCIKAGCPQGGTVLDPFAGSGTVAFVAKLLGRGSVSIELNPAYCDLIRERIGKQTDLFIERAA